MLEFRTSKKGDGRRITLNDYWIGKCETEEQAQLMIQKLIDSKEIDLIRLTELFKKLNKEPKIKREQKSKEPKSKEPKSKEPKSKEPKEIQEPIKITVDNFSDEFHKARDRKLAAQVDEITKDFYTGKLRENTRIGTARIIIAGYRALVQEYVDIVTRGENDPKRRSEWDEIQECMEIIRLRFDLKIRLEGDKNDEL